MSALRLIPLGSNQTEIRTDQATVLFSYRTPVAACVDGIFIRTTQHHSVTTSRHINRWLDGAEAETVDQSVLDTLLDERR